MTLIQELYTQWLGTIPEVERIALLLAVCSACFVWAIGYFILRRVMLPAVEALVVRLAPEHLRVLRSRIRKLNRRLALTAILVVIQTTHSYFFHISDALGSVIGSVGHILLIVLVGFILSAVVGILSGLYDQFSFAKDIPILGLVQVLKLMIFLVTAIMVISTILDRSPTYILSGLGAVAAVLLLVFKDTILGFVASIQIAANRLLRHGDWIQMDKYGADGEVEYLGLNTVKVRNWDHTITTIPTYALISDSFKNWRGMQESGGRRIKRAIWLNLQSIKQLDEDAMGTLKEALGDEWQADSVRNNVTLFRQYATAYLHNHDKLNTELFTMVRELQATQHGLPVEFYCFSADRSWLAYEHLQAEISDHFYAVLPHFQLTPYQVISDQGKMS